MCDFMHSLVRVFENLPQSISREPPYNTRAFRFLRSGTFLKSSTRARAYFPPLGTSLSEYPLYS